MSLKLYYDLLSQPSRALVIFLQAAKVPFEHCPIPLRKSAQLTPEFEQINRFKKLPCIDDKGFKLAESVAILRYICRIYPISDHWYPKDSKQQAKVDEFLEWQHLGLRLHCGMFFMTKWLLPMRTGKAPKPEKVEQYKEQMYQALDVVENLWLKDTPYLTGDKISIADILGACEIEQTKICGVDPALGRKKFSEWLQRVRGDLNPHYDEAHKFVYKIYESEKKNEKSVVQ